MLNLLSTSRIHNSIIFTVKNLIKPRWGREKDSFLKHCHFRQCLLPKTAMLKIIAENGNDMNIAENGNRLDCLDPFIVSIGYLLSRLLGILRLIRPFPGLPTSRPFLSCLLDIYDRVYCENSCVEETFDGLDRD